MSEQQDWISKSCDVDPRASPSANRARRYLVAWVTTNVTLTASLGGDRVHLEGALGTRSLTVEKFLSSAFFTAAKAVSGSPLSYLDDTFSSRNSVRRLPLNAWEDLAPRLLIDMPRQGDAAPNTRLDVPRPTWCEPYSREAVFERDNWICRLCLLSIERGDEEVDHVVPITLGGADAFWNVQASHRKCNQIKSGKPPAGRLIVIPG